MYNFKVSLIFTLSPKATIHSLSGTGGSDSPFSHTFQEPLKRLQYIMHFATTTFYNHFSTFAAVSQEAWQQIIAQRCSNSRSSILVMLL